MMKRTVLALVGGMLLVAGCGSDPNAATPTDNKDDGNAVAGSTAEVPDSAQTATTGVGVDVVVMGDSLINPRDVCPGCAGFVRQYADHVGEALAVPATAYTIPAGGVPDLEATLASDDGARSLVADAEVVVIEVGFNNALPDPETGIGCSGSMASGYVTWLFTTTPECLAQGVDTYGQLYDQIFASISELRGGQPTVLIVTNTIDGNIDPTTDGLLAIAASDQADEVKAWTVSAYDRWNEMVGQRAEAAGFTVVDLYHAFNGPAGDQPSGPLSVDGAHPSQEGHDRIAQLLAEVDLSAIGG